MLECGTVVAVRGDRVDVMMGVSQACGGCSMCSRKGEAEMLMRDVRDEYGVHVGDEVEVEIPEAAKSIAAVAVFAMPVAGAFAGYLAGYLLARGIGVDPEMLGAVLAVVGLVAALAGVGFAERLALHARVSAPRVRAIIARASERT